MSIYLWLAAVCICICAFLYLSDYFFYLKLKKHFSFLHEKYGLEICERQTHGSYFYTAWTSETWTIKVLYDCRETPPMTILHYPAGTFYESTRFTEEIACADKRGGVIMQHAADWLQRAIENGTIKIR